MLPVNLQTPDETLRNLGAYQSALADAEYKSQATQNAKLDSRKQQLEIEDYLSKTSTALREKKKEAGMVELDSQMQENIMKGQQSEAMSSFMKNNPELYQQNLKSGVQAKIGESLASQATNRISTFDNTLGMSYDKKTGEVDPDMYEVGYKALLQIDPGHASDVPTPEEVRNDPKKAKQAAYVLANVAMTHEERIKQEQMEMKIRADKESDQFKAATDMERTKLSAGAQIRSAEIAAGSRENVAGIRADASRYAADMRKQIADSKNATTLAAKSGKTLTLKDVTPGGLNGMLMTGAAALAQMPGAENLDSASKQALISDAANEAADQWQQKYAAFKDNKGEGQAPPIPAMIMKRIMEDKLNDDSQVQEGSGFLFYKGGSYNSSAAGAKGKSIDQVLNKTQLETYNKATPEQQAQIRKARGISD